MAIEEKICGSSIWIVVNSELLYIVFVEVIEVPNEAKHLPCSVWLAVWTLIQICEGQNLFCQRV